METKKIILGLDLGTNSIGWALIKQSINGKIGEIINAGHHHILPKLIQSLMVITIPQSRRPDHFVKPTPLADLDPPLSVMLDLIGHILDHCPTGDHIQKLETPTNS